MGVAAGIFGYTGGCTVYMGFGFKLEGNVRYMEDVCGKKVRRSESEGLSRSSSVLGCC